MFYFFFLQILVYVYWILQISFIILCSQIKSLVFKRLQLLFIVSSWRWRKLLLLSLQGSVWINNMSRIVKSDYQTTNGVIHHIDTLLTPYKLEAKPPLDFRTVPWAHLRLIKVKSESTASYLCVCVFRWTSALRPHCTVTPASINSLR